MRTICFVTGTRAEVGLMRTTLAAIRARADLTLRVVATGMHLDESRGMTVEQVREAWGVDATVDWPATDGGADLAAATGAAMAGVARAIDRLSADVVLVVGDRVEAFAAAAAAAVAGRCVAHVHGGDRAAGQVDDALRHAVTKLAHLHFPATAASAQRLVKLGESAEHVFMLGAPGIDGIRREADPPAAADTGRAGPFTLFVYHPETPDAAAEAAKARRVLKGIRGRVVAVRPNNDPGAGGIMKLLDTLPVGDVFADVPRGRFLALMRDCEAMVGNSSSGIIEAASFGTPVVDVGERQRGREHGPNVIHVTAEAGQVREALSRAKRWDGTNVYGGDGTGEGIARVLAEHPIGPELLRKLITY